MPEPVAHLPVGKSISNDPSPDDTCCTHQEGIARSKSANSNLSLHIHEVSSHSDEEDISIKKSLWQPKWNRTGPLLGLLALIMAALSIPIAFAILKASDGDPVDSWTYSPNVYLAVMTSITGKALALAALQGVVITWWLKAIRGSTLKQLHHDWQMGQNIWDALTAGRRTNMTTLACICAAVAAIDAPLLQRASSVISSISNSTVQLNVDLVEELPAYYSGAIAYPIQNVTINNIITYLNADIDPIMSEWIRQEPIKSVVKGCPEACSVTVRAPMLETWNCTLESTYMDYNEIVQNNLTMTEMYNDVYIQINRTVFHYSLALGAPNYLDTQREFMQLVVQMTDQQTATTCAGHLITKSCLLASAIGEYDLVVRNNETQFANGGPQPRFVAWANNTAITPQTSARFNLSLTGNQPQTVDYQNIFNSTLAGIAYLTDTKFESRISTVPVTAHSGYALMTGIDGQNLLYIKDFPAYTNGKICIPEWIDPSTDIITSANDLMFRTAVHVSRQEFRDDLISETYLHLDQGISDSISYTTNGLYSARVNVFQVDYLFFWCASLVELVCVGVITYTFYGWWRLGRAVSLSPLEVAKAFQSPMFVSTNSNVDAETICKEYGERKIRYGIIGIEADRLGFADAGQTQKPVSGAILSR